MLRTAPASRENKKMAAGKDHEQWSGSHSARRNISATSEALKAGLICGLCDTRTMQATAAVYGRLSQMSCSAAVKLH